jgi:hypothetical protein
MKIRTLLITTASVIALSGAAMADDHLANAQDHGLSDNPNSQGTANSDNRPGQSDNSGTPAPGQGSPFFGLDTQVPASETIEEKVEEGSLPATIIKQCDPATHRCQVP